MLQRAVVNLSNRLLLAERISSSRKCFLRSGTVLQNKMDWTDYDGAGLKSQQETKQWFIKSVMSRVKLPEDCRVLDIGCESGKATHDFLLPLLPPSAKVYALDINPDSIEVAKETYPNSGIKFVQMDARDLNKLDVKFNLIISMYILHFLRDQNRLWESLGQKVTDNGVIAALVPAKNIGIDSMVELVNEEPFLFLKKNTMELFSDFLYIADAQESYKKFQQDIQQALPHFQLDFSSKEVFTEYADEAEFRANFKHCNFFRRMMSEVEADFYEEKLVEKIRNKLGLTVGENWCRYDIYTVVARRD